MTTGKVTKSKSFKSFTVVTNLIAKNPNLSLKAKGLFLTISSLPDDWIIHKTQLQDFSTDGKEAVRSAFDELVKAGFIVSKRYVDEHKKFVGWNHVLYDTPQIEQPIAGFPKSEKPTTEKPTTEKPTTGNPPLLNTDVLNTDRLTTYKLNSNSEKSLFAEIEQKEFDKFWNLYDKKVGRDEALKAWKKLKTSDIDEMFKKVEAYVASKPDKVYRPNPSTFLNQKKWNDEIIARPSTTSNYRAGTFVRPDYNKGLEDLATTPAIPRRPRPTTDPNWNPDSI